MDTHVVATPIVVAPSISSQDHEIGRWPVWSRLAVLLGGSAVLWAGLGWLAFRVMQLG